MAHPSCLVVTRRPGHTSRMYSSRYQQRVITSLAANGSVTVCYGSYIKADLS